MRGPMSCPNSILSRTPSSSDLTKHYMKCRMREPSRAQIASSQTKSRCKQNLVGFSDFGWHNHHRCQKNTPLINWPSLTEHEQKRRPRQDRDGVLEAHSFT